MSTLVSAALLKVVVFAPCLITWNGGIFVQNGHHSFDKRPQIFFVGTERKL